MTERLTVQPAPGSNTAGVVVGVLVALSVLTVGGYLVYRRARRNGERIPLNNIPSMSSLQSR